MELELAYDSPPAEAFVHVRIIIAIILGLCISRLLTGVARFIQHPEKQLLYPVHLGWVMLILLMVIHFWWFEFNLRLVPIWGFEIYLFIVFYAGLHFLLCTILFPEKLDGYTGYRDYFMSRRRWFFGLLFFIYCVDVVDTMIKGRTYFDQLGPEYSLRVGFFLLLSLIAMIIENPRFHAFFISGALIFELAYTLRHFATLT
ncbi:hypothetical protein ACFOLL_17390 [Falsochrobactrum ovis]|uniref:Uncharacterized protein n=1 Tax=Falsochrobactrum ovis TaxID=1293442 RepID=A0A364JRL6_9HYPH|nr:hypothetical protein [Falsochrobactrum ovis]RAK25440.1 hypothetical protein C7374_1243 [Falsochrobactrum ovis]